MPDVMSLVKEVEDMSFCVDIKPLLKVWKANADSFRMVLEGTTLIFRVGLVTNPADEKKDKTVFRVPLPFKERVDEKPDFPNDPPPSATFFLEDPGEFFEVVKDVTKDDTLVVSADEKGWSVSGGGARVSLAKDIDNDKIPEGFKFNGIVVDSKGFAMMKDMAGTKRSMFVQFYDDFVIFRFTDDNRDDQFSYRFTPVGDIEEMSADVEMEGPEKLKVTILDAKPFLNFLKAAYLAAGGKNICLTFLDHAIILVQDTSIDKIKMEFTVGQGAFERYNAQGLDDKSLCFDPQKLVDVKGMGGFTIKIIGKTLDFSGSNPMGGIQKSLIAPFEEGEMRALRKDPEGRGLGEISVDSGEFEELIKEITNVGDNIEISMNKKAWFLAVEAQVAQRDRNTILG